MIPAEKSYLEKLGDLIIQAHTACNHQIPHSDVFEKEKQSWCKTLYGEVPQELLERTIFAAIKSKSRRMANTEKTYMSFGANDVLRYWYEQSEIAREEQRRKRLARRSCATCRGKLTITIYDPVAKSESTIKCPHCIIPKEGDECQGIERNQL